VHWPTLLVGTCAAAVLLAVCCLQAYQLPTYFRDDWLNEYYDVKQKSRQQTALVPPPPQQQCCGSCMGYDAAPHGTFVTCSPGGSQPAMTGMAAAGGATTRLCCRCNLSSGCCCRQVATEANDSSSSSSSSSTSSSSNVVTSDYRFVYCGPAGSWTPLHSGEHPAVMTAAAVAGALAAAAAAPALVAAAVHRTGHAAGYFASQLKLACHLDLMLWQLVLPRP